MISKYETLETAVIARLAPLVTAGATVQLMPETETEFKEPTITKPSLIVAYIGSNYDEAAGKNTTRAIDTAVQEETLQIEVTIRARKLRGATGIFQVKQEVEKWLAGYKVPGFGKMKRKIFQFYGFEAGIWVYKYVFTAETVAVEYCAPETLVNATELNYDTAVTI